jgi:hypothetical protein
MSIEEKQLVQGWCLKTHGIMYAIWKKDAPEEEMKEYIEELGHAVENGDFRFFSRVDGEGKPTVDEPEPEPEPVEDEQEEPEPQTFTDKQEAMEAMTDEQLKAILKAKGYKTDLVPDGKDMLVYVVRKVHIPARFIGEGGALTDDGQSYVEGMVPHSWSLEEITSDNDE